MLWIWGCNFAKILVQTKASPVKEENAAGRKLMLLLLPTIFDKLKFRAKCCPAPWAVDWLSFLSWLEVSEPLWKRGKQLIVMMPNWSFGDVKFKTSSHDPYGCLLGRIYFFHLTTFLEKQQFFSAKIRVRNETLRLIIHRDSDHTGWLRVEMLSWQIQTRRYRSSRIFGAILFCRSSKSQVINAG